MEYGLMVRCVLGGRDDSSRADRRNVILTTMNLYPMRTSLPASDDRYTPAYLAEGDFFTLFKLKLRNFVDGVLRDQPLEAPGEAGAAVQKIVDGVYRSSEAGKEVRIG